MNPTSFMDTPNVVHTIVLWFQAPLLKLTVSEAPFWKVKACLLLRLLLLSLLLSNQQAEQFFRLKSLQHFDLTRLHLSSSLSLSLYFSLLAPPLLLISVLNFQIWTLLPTASIWLAIFNHHKPSGQKMVINVTSNITHFKTKNNLMLLGF